MTTDDQRELLTQVDDQNRVLGSLTRENAHQMPGVFYRTIFVLVRNAEGKFLVQKRSATKDLYPNCWDLSVGGHVIFGDSYAETAMRELKEELGLEIEEQDLSLKGEVLVKLPHSGEFFNVYEYNLKPDDQIRLAADEVIETKWMTIEEIKESMDTGTLQWYERPEQTIRKLY